MQDFKLPAISKQEYLSEYSLQMIADDIYESSTMDNNVGPGSYNLPSTINSKSPGVPYKSVPKYSLGKSPKLQLMEKPCGPGIFYDPDYKVVKQNVHSIKITKQENTSRNNHNTPSPGPKYDCSINKIGTNAGTRISPEGMQLDHSKFITPSTHQYHIASVFDDNKKKRKGATIGVTEKCKLQKNDFVPGPGSYDSLSMNTRNAYSFPKVLDLAVTKTEHIC